MIEVIDFFFELLGQLWQVIVAHWILAISFLIMIFGYIVDLVNRTRTQ